MQKRIDDFGDAVECRHSRRMAEFGTLNWV
jgi:hypothetical protein